MKKITLNYEFVLLIFPISCGTLATHPCLGYRTYLRIDFVRILCEISQWANVCITYIIV